MSGRLRPQDYPPHWREVSQYVRFVRAEGRCECMGECGLHRTHPGPRRCVERHLQPAVWAHGRVVLTTAHLCTCQPLCADLAHLKGLCNRCHLRVDIDLHRRHAAERRRAERIALGQLSFLGVPL